MRTTDHDLVPVVDPDRQVGVPHGIHQESLDVPEIIKDDTLRDEVQPDRGVHLGDLVDHLEGGHALELGDELGKVHHLHRAGCAHLALLLLGLQCREDLVHALAQVQGVEVLLKQGEELPGLWDGELEDTLRLELGEEGSPAEGPAGGVPLGFRGEPEKVGHPSGLLPLELDLIQAVRDLGVVRQNGEGGQHHGGGHELQVLLLKVLVVRPRDVEELVPRVGIVEVPLRDPEHLGEVCVVDGHHLGLWLPLSKQGQRVDVLHGPEGLLPQPELGRHAELLEPGLHVQRQRLRLLEIWLVPLVLVLVQVGEVVPNDLAHALELRLPLVRQAKVVGPLRGHGVQRLQSGVVPQDVKGVSVRLPQELEPGHDVLAVLTVLGVVRRDVGQHEVLGGGADVQILDLTKLLLRRLLVRKRLVARLLGLVRLGVGGLEEPLDDLLQALDVVLLARVPVLDQAILEQPSGLEFDAELDVLEHDGLEGLLPLPVPLAREHVVKGLQGGLGLANPDELLRALEGILGLRKASSSAIHLPR